MPLNILALTGLVLGIQRKEDITVAQSVVVLMIAKGIASPSTSILLGEKDPSKWLMIAAITDQIIWLFVVNNVEKLSGFLVEFNLFCDLSSNFFQTNILKCFLGLCLYFLTSDLFI